MSRWKKCSQCERPATCKGLCKRCYDRWRKAGRPETTTPQEKAKLRELTKRLGFAGAVIIRFINGKGTLPNFAFQQFALSAVLQPQGDQCAGNTRSAIAYTVIRD